MDGAAAPDEGEAHYVGLATRVIAFAIDAAIINLVAIIVEVGAALILSLLHLPKDVKTVVIAIGGAAYILWAIGYFVAFWSATGQTPGARALQIRVQAAKGGELRPRRAFVRVVGVLLAALPLFLGYLPILFDRRRRGLQDRMARTVVVEASQPSYAQEQRARMRAAYVASRGPRAAAD